MLVKDRECLPPRCKQMSSEAAEAEAALRTIECLRARLLAERQASRSAEDQSLLMSNMLVELEKKIKEETRQRDLFQKRLQVLHRKLETVRSREWERSSVSENCSVSPSVGCSPSAADPVTLSFVKDPEEERVERSEPQFEINNRLEETPDSVQKASASIPSTTSSSPGDVSHVEREGGGHAEEGVDCKLAIVLVTATPVEETTRESGWADEYSIQAAREALEALRFAKASIQREMKQERPTTHAMKVGRDWSSDS